MAQKMENEEKMGKMDRRTFLAGAAGVGLLAGIGSLAGCAPSQGGEGSAPPAGEGAGGAPAGGAGAGSAGGAPAAADWLGAPPAITDEECVETVEVDVLVVGAGCAGTVAAAFATEGGAKTLLIEANEAGVAVRSSALGGVGSKYQQAQGIEIDKEEIINDMAHYALNQCDMRLYRNWVDHSAEAIDWYGPLAEEAGMEIHLEWNMPQGTRYKMWPTGHGVKNPNAQGPMDNSAESETQKLILAKYAEKGLEFRNNTKMQSLIKEGEKVVGIYATNPDGAFIRINAAKGVIVATGGYINNQDMYEALQGELKKSLSGYLAFGTAHGDGIKACLWAGARMDTQSTTMIFDRGVIKPDVELMGPDMTEGAQLFTFSTQPFLKVSKSGQRICNESSPYDFVVHGAAELPGKAWYPIWDSTWQEDVLRFSTIGCSTLFSRDGSNHHAPEIEGVDAQMQSLIADGYIVQADTLDDLAAGLGLESAEVFKAEVEKYNGYFAAQYDAEYGKEPFRLSGLDTPPYYGMKVGGLCLCTLDGISVTPEYQALDTELKPIEGLYVIGNDSGNYYVNTYPNFGAGTNAGRCITAGMLVGRALAAQ
jgi:succinate dehydrogenase/fumarate reductase flavoprotein subunit